MWVINEKEINFISKYINIFCELHCIHYKAVKCVYIDGLHFHIAHWEVKDFKRQMRDQNYP
jgi:hypothetical protein